MLDEMIFTLTMTGKFHIKTYIETIRASHPRLPWANLVWISFIPNITNGFMWRLFLEALPLDELTKNRGVYVVSKCSCCRHRNVEGLAHLFLHSDIA